MQPSALAVIIKSAFGAPEIQLVFGHSSATGGTPLAVGKTGQVGLRRGCGNGCVEGWWERDGLVR